MSYNLENNFDIRYEENYSQPVVIVLTNNTDNTLHKVDVFNYEHSKQDKISYHSGINQQGSKYEDVLRILAAINKPESTIGTINASANCDYNKEFADKQLRSKIYEIYSTITGDLHTFEHKFPRDPKALQKDVDMIYDLNFVFFNRMQIQLEYLLPKTQIVLRLFRKKITESK